MALNSPTPQSWEQKFDEKFLRANAFNPNFAKVGPYWIDASGPIKAFIFDLLQGERQRFGENVREWVIGNNEPVSNKTTRGNKPNYNFVTNRNELRRKQRLALEKLLQGQGEIQ